MRLKPLHDSLYDDYLYVIYALLKYLFFWVVTQRTIDTDVLGKPIDPTFKVQAVKKVTDLGPLEL
jgi:hypothetical protein